MYPIKSTLRFAFAATTLALATSAYAQINDSIRGPASEANHFVETPNGWKNPMTPWGEPDIRAKLDMMQASGVPLERCASYDDGHACALEYNVVRWGETNLTPQAGVAIYIRGGSGRLAAARTYDDADPPLGTRG